MQALRILAKTCWVLCLVLLGRMASAQGYVVKLHDANSANSIIQDYGIELLDWTDPAPFYLFSIPPRQAADILEALRADPRVEWVESELPVDTPNANTRSRGGTIPVVGSRSNLYAQNTRMLEQIRWEEAAANEGPQRTRVAILDTGIPLEAPRLWEKAVAWLNTVDPGSPPIDEGNGVDDNDNDVIDEGLGHGSMVAGLIDQISPRSELVICRIADDEGESTSWCLIKGLVFSTLNRALVISVSLGTPFEFRAVSSVVEWVLAHRVIVVAPIGNDDAPIALYPSANEGVLCVAGVDDADRRAEFSNWSERADACAPATGLASLWWDGSIGIWEGTSFATPIVAATVAVGLSYRADLTPDDVRDWLDDTGDEIDEVNPGFEDQLGRRVNFRRFVEHVRGDEEVDLVSIDVSVNPITIRGRSEATGVITLNRPLEEALWVYTWVDGPAMTLGWVMIPPGATRAEFPILTEWVEAAQPGTVFVQAGEIISMGEFEVTP